MCSCLDNPDWSFRVIFPGSPLWNPFPCIRPYSDHTICPSKSPLLASQPWHNWPLEPDDSCLWGCPVHSRSFGSTPDLHPLHASTITQLWGAKIRPWMLRGGQDAPPLPGSDHCIRLRPEGEDSVLLVSVAQRGPEDTAMEQSRRNKWEGAAYSPDGKSHLLSSRKNSVLSTLIITFLIF